MLHIFDPLREFTTASICVRLVLATLCGGLIGIERAFKRRPAGFRTHILICLGSAITTLTSQYLYLQMQFPTDMARIGAQVISGIGFIGAGTIFVTRKNSVKGLTTAAGLWTAAIIGLTLGGGYYEGGIIATFLLLIAETLLCKLEYRLLRHTDEVHVFIHYQGKLGLEENLVLFRTRNIKVLNLEILHSSASGEGRTTAIFTLNVPRSQDLQEVFSIVKSIDGVLAIEEV